MVITDRLKQIIFKQLYKDLGDCEIIPYKDSIWFIDREKEYWYFEFDGSSTLWWRYHFFDSFFKIFSMSSDEFTPILSAWVEEVLNHKVSTTDFGMEVCGTVVEEVLNHKVTTTRKSFSCAETKVEEVLNHKVSTTEGNIGTKSRLVDEVLNQK